MPSSKTVPKTVAVVDYGSGNLRSVAQAVLHAAADSGYEVQITQDPDTVRRAERVVLPGQGAMPDCMRGLHESGLQESVLEAAHNKPLFGVCVGMQMLLEHSEEGDAKGLALVPGDVKKFQITNQKQQDGSRCKVPQMGWNQVRQAQAHPLWQGIPDESWFYFVHSFYACPNNSLHSVGETEYGLVFTSALAYRNIFATQFHPEKSAEQGIALYRNFLHWKP